MTGMRMRRNKLINAYISNFAWPSHNICDCTALQPDEPSARIDINDGINMGVCCACRVINCKLLLFHKFMICSGLFVWMRWY